MMDDRIQRQLARVHRRWKRGDAREQARRGLAAGAWLTAGSALLALETGIPQLALGGLTVGLLLPSAAWMVAMCRAPDWRAAARAVDQKFHLRDAIITALQLSKQRPATPMARIHIDEAVSTLARIDPGDVAPPRWEWRGWRWPLAAVAVAALLLWTARPQPAKPQRRQSPANAGPEQIVDIGPDSIDAARLVTERNLHASSAAQENIVQYFERRVSAD